MKTDTTEKIIQYIRRNGQVRPYDIGRFLGIGQVAVHRQLKRLTLQGELERVGTPPLVFYTLRINELDRVNQSLNSAANKNVASNLFDDILVSRKKSKHISSQEEKDILEQSRKELLNRI
jgi:predicted ArsR family transcriptional regulator